MADQRKPVRKPARRRPTAARRARPSRRAPARVRSTAPEPEGYTSLIEPRGVGLPSSLAPVGGFGVTLSNMFRPTVTEQYPSEKVPAKPRYHGRHQLNRYADGLEKCIGCELCAWACPADAIYVEGADNTPDDQRSPGERYGSVYQINYLRCIFCGLCIEACPTRALTMTNEYELAGPTRAGMIWEKQDLLAPLRSGHARRRRTRWSRARRTPTTTAARSPARRRRRSPGSRSTGPTTRRCPAAPVWTRRTCPVRRRP